jgi:hypothetical protein
MRARDVECSIADVSVLDPEVELFSKSSTSQMRARDVEYSIVDVLNLPPTSVTAIVQVVHHTNGAGFY